MRQFVFEDGQDYRIVVDGGGVALTILNKASGKDAHLQGDEAGVLYDELCELATDHGKPGTRASRFSWPVLLDTAIGCYF